MAESRRLLSQLGLPDPGTWLTPLHFVSQRRQEAMVELLLRNHADPYALDCYGRSSYYWINLDPDLRSRFNIEPRREAPSGKCAPETMLRRTIHKLTTLLLDHLGEGHGVYPMALAYSELRHALIFFNRCDDASYCIRTVHDSRQRLRRP